jgi:hypothetical protein
MLKIVAILHTLLVFNGLVGIHDFEFVFLAILTALEKSARIFHRFLGLRLQDR